MLTVNAEPDVRPITLPDTNAQAYRLIAELFRNAERPSLVATGEIVRHGSDGIESPVYRAEGWKNGKYIKFEEYSGQASKPLTSYYNVSGTGPNGEYIPPHRVNSRGERDDTPSTPRAFRLYEEEKMKSLLDLEKASSRDEQGREYYTRKGFEGRYYLQTEEDGQVSVHYTGGRHQSGVQLPPQTFVNGSWDVTRRDAVPAQRTPQSPIVGLQLPSSRYRT